MSERLFFLLLHGTRIPRVLGILCIAGILVLPALGAQTVRVSVVDSVSRAPVVDGFVVLLDMDGNVVRRVLNSGASPLSLRAPAAGYYLLRSERIGYGVSISEPILLPEDEVLNYELTVAALPVRLEAIQVEETRRCRANPAEGRETAIVWEEVRKALEAAVWTAQQGGYWYRSRLFARELDVERRRVSSEESREQAGTYKAPFASVPPEQLETDGYVVSSDNGWRVFAPDAVVLLDPSFLNSHCFRVVREADRDERRVGLAFEPVVDRELADVSGTLWLDEGSSELRTLEFSYTNLPHDVQDNRLGGTMHFMPTPSGAWIVRDWQLRMPLMEVRNVGFGRRGMLEQGIGLGGFRDAGGEVLEIRNRDGGRVYAADLATVAGVVTDAATGRPVSGAKVLFAGTADTTVTDLNGRFSLSGPYEGEYGLTYVVPQLDGLGFEPDVVPVTLVRGQTSAADLRMARPETVLRSVCSNARTDGDVRAVIGVVRGRTPDTVVFGAQVIASWSDSWSVAEGNISQGEGQSAIEVDSTGFFRLCGIPADTRITLSVQLGSETGGWATVIFDESGVFHNEDPCVEQVARQQTRPRTALECQQRRVFQETSQLVWRQDLVFGPEMVGTAVVRGTVTDALRHEPLGGAEIRVTGTEFSVRTDAAGQFELTEVPTGVSELGVRHLSFAPRQLVIMLSAGDTLALPDSVLTMGVVQLEPVVVEARAARHRRDLTEFETRREQGVGSFITRAEFETQGNPTVSSDVLRRMDGLSFAPGASFMQRWVITTRRGQSRGRVFITRPGQGCYPLVFLDGAFLGTTSPIDGIDVDESIPLNQVEAVEVYAGAAGMPLRFNRPGSTCGAIAFWTR
jgi:hypothetical protein